jgi:hypothetical protein
MKTKALVYLLLMIITLSSCQSEEERQKQIAKEEQQRIELEEKRKVEEAQRAFQLEQDRIEREKREEAERIEREAKLEKERREKEIYDKYINNSLSTGSTPYSYCYGRNSSCSGWGCSEIKITTPHNSDVLVIIKKGEKVVSHAYIKNRSSYTFELPNGNYQPFFYYGKRWNPEKVMKQTDCGTLKGGFIANEDIGKDDPQSLINSILTYELILQERGNFSTRPSNVNEAF